MKDSCLKFLPHAFVVLSPFPLDFSVCIYVLCHAPSLCHVELTPYVSVSVSLNVLSLSLSLSACLSLSVGLSVCLSVSLPLSLPLSLSFSLPPVSLSLSLSLSLSHALSPSLILSVSLSPSLSLSLSPSLSVCLSLSLSCTINLAPLVSVRSPKGNVSELLEKTCARKSAVFRPYVLSGYAVCQSNVDDMSITQNRLKKKKKRKHVTVLRAYLVKVHRRQELVCDAIEGGDNTFSGPIEGSALRSKPHLQ